MKPRHLIPTLFLFLLVAYPLSIGPVLRINYNRHVNGPILPPALQAFYSPLWRLCQSWQPAGDALRAYGDLWLR
jgi:hypothetical protein